MIQHISISDRKYVLSLQFKVKFAGFFFMTPFFFFPLILWLRREGGTPINHETFLHRTRWNLWSFRSLLVHGISLARQVLLGPSRKFIHTYVYPYINPCIVRVLFKCLLTIIYLHFLLTASGPSHPQHGPSQSPSPSQVVRLAFFDHLYNKPLPSPSLLSRPSVTSLVLVASFRYFGLDFDSPRSWIISHTYFWDTD